MGKNKKTFVLIEAVLAIIVGIVAFLMILESRDDEFKVSVIIRDSDDNRWSAFKYGLQMAAEDEGAEIFVVGTDEVLTAEEERSLLEEEINNGADAVIMQPVPGEDPEEIVKEFGSRLPIMFVEHASDSDGRTARTPAVGADDYAMGSTLAEELLRDYGGSLEGKRLGILSQTTDLKAVYERVRGLENALEDKGAKKIWMVSGSFIGTDINFLAKQPEVDILIAFDDDSLTMAGECAAANSLHGAQIYGIGNSTEAVYYLDTGAVECLLIPDEFSVGYRSMTEVVGRLKRSYWEIMDERGPHTVVRRETLFSEENEGLFFVISQK